MIKADELREIAKWFEEENMPGHTAPLNKLADMLDQIVLDLDDAVVAKRRHKYGTGCSHPNTCGRCHYYSGRISALSELLGEKGRID